MLVPHFFNIINVCVTEHITIVYCGCYKNEIDYLLTWNFEKCV